MAGRYRLMAAVLPTGAVAPAPPGCGRDTRYAGPRPPRVAADPPPPSPRAAGPRVRAVAPVRRCGAARVPLPPAGPLRGRTRRPARVGSGSAHRPADCRSPCGAPGCAPGRRVHRGSSGACAGTSAHDLRQHAAARRAGRSLEIAMHPHPRCGRGPHARVCPSGGVASTTSSRGVSGWCVLCCNPSYVQGRTVAPSHGWRIGLVAGWRVRASACLGASSDTVAWRKAAAPPAGSRALGLPGRLRPRRVAAARPAPDAARRRASALQVEAGQQARRQRPRTSRSSRSPCCAQVRARACSCCRRPSRRSCWLWKIGRWNHCGMGLPVLQRQALPEERARQVQRRGHAAASGSRRRRQ